MLGLQKNNIAILICSALLFRILFVSISTLAYPFLLEQSHGLKINHSALFKREKQLATITQDHCHTITAYDVAEENENTREKSILPFTLSISDFRIYSPETIAPKGTILNQPFVSSSSPHYLTLQVIRI
jgi:hypothetical protein